MRGLKDAMEECLRKKIMDEGFNKKSRGLWYSRKGDKEPFQSLVGFSFMTYHIGRAVSVNVGIYNTQIEQLYVKLSKHKLVSPYWLLSINLGELEPTYRKYKDWYFTDFSEISGICDTIFDELYEFGYPFFRKYESINSIIEVFEKNNLKGYHASDSDRFFTMPLLYIYNKEYEKALDVMVTLQRFGYQMDEFSENYFNNVKEYLSKL